MNGFAPYTMGSVSASFDLRTARSLHRCFRGQTSREITILSIKTAWTGEKSDQVGLKRWLFLRDSNGARDGRKIIYETLNLALVLHVVLANYHLPKIQGNVKVKNEMGSTGLDSHLPGY